MAATNAPVHLQPLSLVLDRYHVDPAQGLSHVQVEESRELHGSNAIRGRTLFAGSARKSTPLVKLLQQLAVITRTCVHSHIFCMFISSTGEGKVSAFKLLIEHLTNALTLVLVIVLALSIITQQVVECVVIAIIIVFNTAVGFFQEYKYVCAYLHKF